MARSITLKIIQENAFSEASFSTLVIHHFRPLPAATTYPASPSTPVRVIRKAKHRTGYNPQWTLTRPWLYSKSEKNEDETFSQVMFCQLCEKHQIKARNGSGVWATEGCRTQRLDKVVNHETSEQHQEALRLETGSQLNIETSFNESVNQEEFRAISAAMKCLHFLIKHNIPHTTLFKEFINFATDELKCPDLQHLSKGKNAQYTSNSMID